jgi:hypothetical protein
MTRFCIVLAEGPHRLVFADVVESLCWGLRQLGHDPEAATYPRPGVRNIILAPHLLLAIDEEVRIEPGTIVYNGEPLWSPLFVRSLRLLGNPKAEVWDYSRTTTKALADIGIAARTVPYAWSPATSLVPLAEPRTVDVLFVGSRSPRRDRILSKLAAVPELSTHTLFGVYGDVCRQWLARSKVALNVHYWPEGGCEDLRLLAANSMLCASVSEGEPDEPYKRPWAKWAPYDQIAEECVYQAKSGAWQEQALRGESAVRSHDAATVLREALR